MFNIVKKVVAGPKNTITYQGQDLDLTYITNRVIAMAFPATNIIEKTYRNSIQDVASYLEEKHRDNYLILNVSSRKYNYTIFKHKVKDYQWPDHQAPSFTTLVQAAFDMYRFLSCSRDSVVAVHCNHGKGRTGTSIIALMLLIGYHQSAKQSLLFYNSKRFNKSTYGVDQPCQLRYLQFIQQIKHSQEIGKKLICYRLKGMTQRGLSQEYYIKITVTRSQQVVHEKLKFNKQIKQGSKRLLSDIFIELYCDNWSGSKRIVRINYNLFFLRGETKIKFKGNDIKVQGGHSKDFQIVLYFQYYCLCHLPKYQPSHCSCLKERNLQEKYWATMIEQIKECKQLKKEESTNLLFGSQKGPFLSCVQARGCQQVLLQRHRSYDSRSPFRNSRQQKLYACFLASKQRMSRQFSQQNQHEQSQQKQRTDKIYHNVSEQQEQGPKISRFQQSKSNSQ